MNKHWDILAYLFFGGLTTLVNFLVYMPLFHWLHLSAALSNAVAWVAAVAFAYLTNKPFVFKSNDWTAKTVLPELGKFVGCRVGSGVLETLLLYLCVDILAWNGVVMKILTSIFVVILNYISSKLLVFHKPNTGLDAS
ncbi:MAG: GtrA family protein [Oscillospiraceae bacterium]|nr:GtrA family protein [Oscillospiraceae bacterium]